MCSLGGQEDSHNLAQNQNRSSNRSHCRGKLFLVGIGSGNSQHLTPQALRAIKQAEVVVGYQGYLQLIADLLEEKQVVSSGMRREVQRAEAAIDNVCAGKVVAVISSGDAGIYGMAGLVFEVLHKRELDLPVEVVPGITAATLAAAALGAPLMNDFVVISLSDLLTPWPLIEKRLQLAAQGDWVVVLYNPKSHTRTSQIERAQAILLEQRSPDTPVGIVYKAGRSQEQRVISDLAHFLEEEIDMSTVIIVGNSQSFIYNDFLVTPRGYQL